MKLFTAAMITESSDLTAIPTTEKEWVVEEPFGAQERHSLFYGLLTLFSEMASRKGWEIKQSICAYALPPGGRTVRPVYEKIRDRILLDAKQAMPLDGVLLQLHGASLAYGYDDCEGDLLEKLRAIVGDDIPIGVELDPHCHLTDKMLKHSTIIICYKTFMHTDIKDRAIDLFNIFTDTLSGKVRPVMAVFDCHMADFFDEALEPMKTFYSSVLAKEKDKDILSVSLVHGFPLADVADMGAKVLVVTDNDPQMASSIARELGEDFFKTKGQMSLYGSIGEALDKAEERHQKKESMVPLVEFSDLAGCGFPTDSTELLRAMMSRGMDNFVAGIIWDPLAVSICMNVDVGTHLMLRIGGKSSIYSGLPLDLRVSVKRLYHSLSIDTWLGKANLGDTAIVESGRKRFILSSNRVLGYGIDSFSELTGDISNTDYLVMKYVHDCVSPIYVYGASYDHTQWKFEKVRRPKWPWENLPLGDYSKYIIN